MDKRYLKHDVYLYNYGSHSTIKIGKKGQEVSGLLEKNVKKNINNGRIYAEELDYNRWYAR